MEIKTKDVLKRMGDLEREIEYIKRDLMHLEAVQQFKIGRKRKVDNALNQKRRNIFGAKTNCETASLEEKPKQKPSLFGCVRGGDITDEMIEEAKKDLFREAEGA